MERSVALGVGEVDVCALLHKEGDDARRSLLEHRQAEHGPGLAHLLRTFSGMRLHISSIRVIAARLHPLLPLHLARRHHKVDIGPVLCPEEGEEIAREWVDTRVRASGGGAYCTDENLCSPLHAHPAGLEERRRARGERQLVGIGTGLDQAVHHFLLVVHLLALHLNLALGVAAQLRLLLLFAVGNRERSPALVVLDVGIGIVLQQQPDPFQIVLLGTHVQRCKAWRRVGCNQHQYQDQGQRHRDYGKVRQA